MNLCIPACQHRMIRAISESCLEQRISILLDFTSAQNKRKCIGPRHTILFIVDPVKQLCASSRLMYIIISHSQNFPIVLSVAFGL